MSKKLFGLLVVLLLVGCGGKAPSVQEVPVKGSRLNPLPFDEPYTFIGTYGDYPVEFTICLRELIRGSEAVKKMKSDYQFNKRDKGEEPIYFTVDFRLDYLESEDDDFFYIDDDMFEYFKSDYALYKSRGILWGYNYLDSEMYEGSSTSGQVGLIIPKKDVGYICFKDNLWFKLPE